MNANSISWERFLVDDIFKIENCKAYHKISLKETKSANSIPYVTRTNQDNGLECLVEVFNKISYNSQNAISFGAENATFFFQPYKFITGNKMYVAKNEHINRYVGLFLQVVFNKSIENCGFGYGKGLTGTRFGQRYIQLPVSSHGIPNWNYMESYMKELEKKLLSESVKFISRKLAEDVIVSPPPSITYKEFYFSDVFDEIQRGKRLTRSAQLGGIIPYVSSTAGNNGIDAFIGNVNNLRKFENCLSLANSGSVGSTFFHSYEFIASDHITKLKRNNTDKYVYLYMIPIINRLSAKYGFNREITDTRIKREKILLPISKSGAIDFEYMSSFMHSLEQKTLRETIDILLQLRDTKRVPPPPARAAEYTHI